MTATLPTAGRGVTLGSDGATCLAVRDSPELVAPPARGLRPTAAQAGLVTSGFVAYMAVRAVSRGAHDLAIRHAQAILSWERDAGIDIEQDLQRAIGAPGLGRNIINAIYAGAYWPALLLGLGVTWRWDRHRYRILRDALLISGVIGLLIFAIYPVAPPRMLDGFTDTVPPTSRQHFIAHPSMLINPYAAFPSFHFGWFALSLLVLLWRKRRAVWLSAIGTSAMAIAVIATANHFVVDVAGGLVICGAALWAARCIERSRIERSRMERRAGPNVDAGCPPSVRSWSHAGRSPRRHVALPAEPRPGDRAGSR
jgi:hypothetical protein